jgi:hypothetical protein
MACMACSRFGAGVTRLVVCLPFESCYPNPPLFRQYPLWYILLFHPGRNTSRHTATANDATQPAAPAGHSGLEMTNRYIHFASAGLAAIQERVAPMDKLEIKPMRVPRRK